MFFYTPLNLSSRGVLLACFRSIFFSAIPLLYAPFPTIWTPGTGYPLSERPEQATHHLNAWNRLRQTRNQSLLRVSDKVRCWCSRGWVWPDHITKGWGDNLRCLRQKVPREPRASNLLRLILEDTFTQTTKSSCLAWTPVRCTRTNQNVFWARSHFGMGLCKGVKKSTIHNCWISF